MIIFVKAFLRNMEEEPAVHLNYTSFLKLKLKKKKHIYVLLCACIFVCSELFGLVILGFAWIRIA